MLCFTYYNVLDGNSVSVISSCTLGMWSAFKAVKNPVYLVGSVNWKTIWLMFRNARDWVLTRAIELKDAFLFSYEGWYTFAKFLDFQNNRKHYMLTVNILFLTVIRGTRNWWIIHAFNGRCSEKMAKIWPSEIPGNMEKVVGVQFSTWNPTKYVKQISRRTLECI